MEGFSENAIRSLAKIIGDYYPDDVSALFPGMGYIGVTLEEFAASQLASIQERAGGNPKPIFDLIRTMCDPQAHVSDPAEFKQMRDQINKLLTFRGRCVTGEGHIVDVEATKTLDVPQTPKEKLFDSRCFHDKVVRHGRRLFIDGSFLHSVLECCKAFESVVRKNSNIQGMGQPLMGKAFNSKNGPIRINACSTESEQNEQDGYMHLSMGLMSAVRNPQSHEPEKDWPVTSEDSLDILSLISFLFRKLDAATMIQTGGQVQLS